MEPAWTYTHTARAVRAAAMPSWIHMDGSCNHADVSHVFLFCVLFIALLVASWCESLSILDFLRDPGLYICFRMVHTYTPRIMSAIIVDIVFELMAVTQSAHTMLSRTGFMFELPLHFSSNTPQHVLGRIFGLPSQRARSVRFTPRVRAKEQ